MAKTKSVEPKTLTGIGGEIAASLNKKYKNSSTRVIYGLTDDNVSNVTGWVSSGCSVLDLAMSNLPNGGFPMGRTTMLYGPEQSGKSLLAMHAIASTQQQGGIGIYVDAEHSLHAGFCKAIGVKTEELVIIPSNEVEYVFDAIIKCVEEIRDRDKTVPITVVLDSVASLVMADDMEADFTVKGYNTKRSIAFSNGLPKITSIVNEHNVCMIMTNQARYKLDRANVYESPWKAPCGQAIPHYASIIIFMQKAGKIKGTVNGLVRIVGRKTKAIIEKNRLGPPEGVVFFDTYFDRGVDNYGSWSPYIDPFKVCKKAGSYFTYDYIDPTSGEVTEYKAQGWDAFCREVLLKHPEVAADMWSKLCDKYITTYSSRSEQMEIVHEDEEVAPEYEVPFEEID